MLPLLFVAAVVGVVAQQQSCASDATGFHKGPLPASYTGGLAEFSVVFTDRALNHMSDPFIDVMFDLNDVLCEVYGARQAVIVPGGGTYAMEAVARQLLSAPGSSALVIRNGYFSYRWTDIFQQGGLVSEEDSVVLKAQQVPGDSRTFEPRPLEEVAAAIDKHKPTVVFAPHVETALGMVLPKWYIADLARLAHDAGALLVIDAVASGTTWLDMRALGIDVLITAPQKAWSAPACAGVVMLSQAGQLAVESSTSSSMALNLRKWKEVMDAYLAGGHAYHATMPTDCLWLFREAAMETRAIGWKHTEDLAADLGAAVRAMLAKYGFESVTEGEYTAPGVVVVYNARDPDLVANLRAHGVQVAGGVPWKLDEDIDTKAATFRIGLFGVDKLRDVSGTVAKLEAHLKAALAK